MRKWKKAALADIQRFMDFLPKEPGVEPRKMFGYPCAFVNGNLFCGLHENNLLVRLPQERRKTLLAQGWTHFEPFPGQVMREYLVLPKNVAAEPKKAAAIFMESFLFVRSLPPKTRKR